MVKGVITAGAAATAFRTTRSIAGGEQHVYQITVPNGAIYVRASVPAARPNADVDLYLLDCTTLDRKPAATYDRTNGGKSPPLPDVACAPKAKAAGVGPAGARVGREDAAWSPYPGRADRRDVARGDADARLRPKPPRGAVRRAGHLRRHGYADSVVLAQTSVTEQPRTLNTLAALRAGRWARWTDRETRLKSPRPKNSHNCSGQLRRAPSPKLSGFSAGAKHRQRIQRSWFPLATQSEAGTTRPQARSSRAGAGRHVRRPRQAPRPTRQGTRRGH